MIPNAKTLPASHFARFCPKSRTTNTWFNVFNYKNIAC